MNSAALGAALNLSLKCWDTLFPRSMRHDVITLDLMGLAKAYQQQYRGATYSGPGGGYLIVVSDVPVPGAFKVNIRTVGK